MVKKFKWKDLPDDPSEICSFDPAPCIKMKKCVLVIDQLGELLYAAYSGDQGHRRIASGWSACEMGLAPISSSVFRVHGFFLLLKVHAASARWAWGWITARNARPFRILRRSSCQSYKARNFQKDNIQEFVRKYITMTIVEPDLETASMRVPPNLYEPRSNNEIEERKGR